MTKVLQHLWFTSGMDEALAFYTRLVPGSEIEWTSVLPVDTPGGPAGSVRLAGFRLGDQRYMAVETPGPDVFNHSFSIVVECDGQAELDRIWNAFLDGGTAEQCGWLRDRWGLSWQIVPKRLGELMSSPDPEAVKRVALALMGMIKLDEAALEAAARGR